MGVRVESRGLRHGSQSVVVVTYIGMRQEQVSAATRADESLVHVALDRRRVKALAVMHGAAADGMGWDGMARVARPSSLGLLE